MTEIFKTDVEQQHGGSVLKILAAKFPKLKCNFDFEDCDRVLRVEGNHFSTEEIMSVLSDTGYSCLVLE